MVRQLDDAETRASLGAGTRTGKLAWVTKSGRPAVTPIWFVVDEERPPCGFVKIDGWAELTDDPEARRAFATGIGGRYMGRTERRISVPATVATGSGSCASGPNVSARSPTSPVNRGTPRCR